MTACRLDPAPHTVIGGKQAPSARRGDLGLLAPESWGRPERLATRRSRSEHGAEKSSVTKRTHVGPHEDAVVESVLTPSGHGLNARRLEDGADPCNS